MQKQNEVHEGRSTVAQKGQSQISLPKHKTISQNTNRFLKTQINFSKHEPVCQNTNQFLETRTNFLKHKPISRITNQWTGLLLCNYQRAWKGLIPRIFRVQHGEFCNAVAFAEMFWHNCGSEVLKEYLYGSQCGTKLDIAIPSFWLLLSSENLTEKEAIQAYFNSGFTYKAILCFLEKHHDMSMSLSALKRRLFQYNLKRNKTDVDLSDVERLIRNELYDPGSIS